MEGEVVISASKDNNVFVWEPQSLTVLANFIDNSSINTQSLAYTGDYIIAAQGKRSLLHYYLFGKESPDKKSSVLEEVTSLSYSNALLLGGSVSGSLYLWDLNSSTLLQTWQPHRNKINLTNLDDWIISSADDASIKIFRTSLVLQGFLSAHKEISINLLPITGMIRLGAIFMTCGKDKSFNVFKNWELQQQKFFSSALKCLEVNNSTGEVFLGSESGEVLLVKSGVAWEIDAKPITNVRMTLNEQFLLVSSQKIYLIDPTNGNKIKSFSMHLTEVECLLCVPRPQDFVAGNLIHKTIKPLKKVVEEEPGVVEFTFTRSEFEEVKAEDTEQKVDNKASSEELEKVKQANAILYRMWVEHCC